MYSILFFHITLHIAYILKYIKKNIALLYFIFILKNLYNIFYWIEIYEERLIIQYLIYSNILIQLLFIENFIYYIYIIF